MLLNNELDDFTAAPGASNAFGLVGFEANLPGPGKRPLSSMSPTIVLKDGKPVLVTGSPGGSRIISTVLQVIVNVLDYDMDVAAAVAAPRLHHQWLPDEVRVERGFADDALAALKAKGHHVVEPLGQTSANSIAVTPTRIARRPRSAYPWRGGRGHNTKAQSANTAGRNDMTSLKGKTLFVSGGSRGIGLAIALRAARDGANVAIAAKTAEPHPKLKGTIYTAADEVRAAGGKALPILCDIREEAQVIAAIDKTVAEFGGIDICVNNASAISLTNSQMTDMKRFDLMMGINTRGTFMVSKYCIPHLKKAENPHILMLSPPLDMQAKWFEHSTAYTMAKFGMSMCVLGLSARTEDPPASRSTRCGRAPPSPPPRSAIS